MTKKFLLFMTLLLSCIGYARAQEELTVYDEAGQSSYVPAYILYWDDFTRCQLVMPADELSDMAGGTISALTFYTDQTADYTTASTADVYLMEVDYTTISAFEQKTGAEIVYSGTFTVNANGTITLEFSTPFFYSGGNLLIGIENTTDAGYKNIKFYGDTSCSGASISGYNSSSLDAVTPTQRNFLPKTTFTYEPGGEAPAVAKPKNVTVDYTGGTEATVSWTSDATAFDIDVNGTVTEDVANPYTLTDLTMGTTYAVKVRAKNGTDVSDWTNPVSFITDLCMPEDQCIINITLTDSYADGWNGGKLEVVDVETEIVLGTFTLTTGGNSSYTLSVCNGREIKFVYTTGSYATENGWLITDVNDEVIAEHEGCNEGCAVAAGVIATYLVDCTVALAQKPTNLTVSEVTFNTADISWTGSADSYNLRYKIDESFVTDFDDSSLGEWTTIDADGDGYGWVLGTAIGGVYLTEGSSLAGKGHNDSQDLIVSGSYSNVVGALTPDNYLVSPKLTLGGSISLWAKGQDASYSAEVFGVAVSTRGNTDPADFTMVGADKTATADWVQYTFDLSAFSGEGYVAIRHYNCTDQFVLDIDNIVIELPEDDDSWTVVNGVTSPYTIEGLNEDTKYQVQVQSVYTDGESDWTGLTFTTLMANPVPDNIAADLVADGATITWNGEGNSYNLRYRTAGSTETSFFDDFESGLSNWTIYTEGEHLDGYNGWTAINMSESGTDINAISFSYYNSTAYNADNWLITPAVDLKSTLSFDVDTHSSYPDSYEVLLSTTGNAIEDFTITLQAMQVATSGQVNIDLSSYAGQKGYVAIHHVSNDCYYLAINNFGIFGESTPAGEWVTISTDIPEATLSGLVTNNAYEYQIQSVKDDNTSEWSEIQDFALLTLANDADNTNLIVNNMGRLAHVTLANRTLFKDGSWNTLCLPFDIDDIDGSTLVDATVKTLFGATAEGSTITLEFDDYDFAAGIPYIIKWENGADIENPQFANVVISASTARTLIYANGNVKFVGYYNPVNITAADDDIYYLTADNTLKYTGKDRTLKAFRAYFQFAESEGARTFILDFGEGGTATTIGNLPAEMFGQGDWYTPSGIKVGDSLPAKKGIYINNGKKVVIK